MIHANLIRRVKHDTVLAYAGLWRRSGMPPHHHATCLLWALAAMTAARKHGAGRVALQGGTAHWQVVHPLYDDPGKPNQLCYQCDLPFPAMALHRRLTGGMPEVHFWAAARWPGEDWHVLDPTVRWAGRRFEEFTGVRASARLPGFICADIAGMPAGVGYRPTADACLFGMKCVQDMRQAGQITSRQVRASGVVG